MTWYIVDGMDGVGKSSVARHIKGVREREGRRVAVFTHPCRGTRIGRLEAKFLTIPGKPAKILSIIFYVLDVLRSVSYMNRRRKDYDDIIFVRYIMEVAYLGDRSMPLAYRFFEHFFPPMEVPILVDLDPDEAFRRIGSRGEELEVYETPEKLREIGGRMRRLAEEHGWYVVDNGGSEEETHGIIRDILDSSEKHRILLHPP